MITLKVIKSEKVFWRICKILRLLVNTLTADEKYSLINRGTLTEAIQVQLTQNKKFFSIFFSILKIYMNFWIFFKKMVTLIADIFPKLRTLKNVVRQMSKKSRFREAFDYQHCKRAQTLLKSERKHLNHICWSLRRQLS